ncbi:MAG: TetR/AcrR family transcriptional regulator [Flavobacteriia bacterium]|nr:TetR/AcrR family transcriptional regulator [Flavobacteriia bacterium]
MDSKKNEIIEKAGSVFMKYGIKSVTMDDIARELIISKKTLYQYFEDKNDLVIEIIKNKTLSDKCICDDTSKNAKNAIEELFEVSKYVSQMMSGIHPSIFFDLKKFHPEAWKIIYNHKWDFVYQLILQNIERGISEGLYRNDVHKEIVAFFYVSTTDLIADSDFLYKNKFTSDEIFKENILFHLHGLMNEKGKEIFNQII